MEENPQTDPLAAPKVRNTVFSFLKLVTLGVLALLLMIPVASLLGLVRERQSRADEVRREIGATWGHEQTLGAVIVTLPFRDVEKHVGGDGSETQRYVTRYAHFLPAASDWRGTLEPEVRARGIFEVPVYRARLEAKGHFESLDLASLSILPADVLWDRVVVTVGLTDLRGIEERLVLGWGGEELELAPGARVPGLSAELEVRLGDRARDLVRGEVPFHLDLVLRGTERIRFLPLGDVTTVELAAPWPDPGFDGAYLPQKRTISTDGFTGSWSVPYFGRGFPRSWRADTTERQDSMKTAAQESAFGVTLVRPADQYQQTERSVKYAILFIVLTFTTLFLLELLSPVRLHPMHYLLVGFALCLFYLVLLALAEHVGFLAAYLAAAAAIVSLVTLYVRSVLGSWRRSAPLAGTLAVLYGYLYGLLRVEDYGLLMGAAGLFAILAVVMYLTRKLDWWTLSYKLREPSERAG